MKPPIKGTETHRAEITRSRSKRKPFKVRWIAENGLVLAHCILSTRANCFKNIRSMMSLHTSVMPIIVQDNSGSAAKRYRLGYSTQEEIDQ
jgi:hypothetical protein